MSVCFVKGCGVSAGKNGFCSKHYQRLRKNGSTDDYLGCHGVLRICSVAGCGGNVDAKGLCRKHYQRFKKHGSPDDNGHSHAPVEERFWRYVHKTDGCWLWTGGSKNQKGYGQIGLGGKGAKHVLVHRLSYTMHKGEIPDGMLVMHSCDNPSCVNPEHLSVGTQSQNILEAFAKGRKNAVPPHVFGEACGASKISEAVAISILASKEPTKVLMERFGVSKSIIQRLRAGHTWKHLPR